VIAFEPQRIVFQTLCANMALNSITNAVCYPFAVGNENGMLQLPDFDYSKEGNFGGIEIDKFNQGQPVHIVKLDDFLQPQKLNFLKIDVEGMEYAVIAGAKNLIAKHKPVLYVENDRKDKSKALIELIQSLNYRLFWHKPALFNPQNFYQNSENDFPNIVSINMLCMHRSVNITVDSGLQEILSADETAF